LNAVCFFVKSSQFKLVELSHVYDFIGLGSQNSSLINLPKKVWGLKEIQPDGGWFELKSKYKTEALKEGKKDWMKHKKELDKFRKSNPVL
jgi:hypothetical protein